MSNRIDTLNYQLKAIKEAFDIWQDSGLNKEILEKVIQNAYKEFYLRPKIILSFLKRIDSLSSCHSLFKNFINFLKILYNENYFFKAFLRN